MKKLIRKNAFNLKTLTCSVSSKTDNMTTGRERERESLSINENVVGELKKEKKKKQNYLTAL